MMMMTTMTTAQSGAAGVCSFSSKRSVKRSFNKGSNVRARSARSAKAFVTKSEYSVTVLGAAGGIGQSLSLLLKMNPLISDLRLYDLANTPGVAADLSHTNTTCKVRGFMGAEQLEDALKGADLVIIPAGVPRKPGMTRDDLFSINAGIVRDLCQACTKACPNALINIISNPVNSTVPIASEVFKKAGCYDPKKIFGVTTLDIVRANTFVSEAKDLDVNEVDVPVIGGHAGITILPLLSQTYPSCEFSADEREKLTVRIQNAGTEVVEAKAGAGSATLSMAYAAARMAEACLRGLSGEPDVYECTFVASSATELPYFATKVRLGPNGAEEVMPIGDITDYEAEWLAKLKVELKSSIDKGIAFVNDN
jgi:malate dehydrogenase